MRSSLVFGSLMGYSLLAAMTATASEPMLDQMLSTDSTVEAHGLSDAEFLLHEVERIRARGVTSDCDQLEPIPVYELSPSVHDWETYCMARVQNDVSACDRITARMIPDLHQHCIDASTSSLSSHGA